VGLKTKKGFFRIVYKGMVKDAYTEGSRILLTVVIAQWAGEFPTFSIATYRDLAARRLDCCLILVP